MYSLPVKTQSTNSSEEKKDCVGCDGNASSCSFSASLSQRERLRGLHYKFCFSKQGAEDIYYPFKIKWQYFHSPVVRESKIEIMPLHYNL